mgnify:CR=1 FL=1
MLAAQVFGSKESEVEVAGGMMVRGIELTDGETGSLPPYLAAAAAMESRAFPAYSYDPSAGPNWASRFDLEANSQVEADWPVQDFTYEDENHQRVRAATGQPWPVPDGALGAQRARPHLAELLLLVVERGLAGLLLLAIAREVAAAPRDARAREIRRRELLARAARDATERPP